MPDATRAMWLCETIVRALALVGIAFLVASFVDALMPWLPLAIAIGAVPYVVVVPRRRYERWRWALHEEELDLLSGVYAVRRTIVPITRIQHVAVERTGWTNAFGLVRLHAYTAAGDTEIPGLEPAQADDVRDRILERLRTPDDL